MGFKKWKLPQTAPERVENLISQTGMERIAAQILDGRGISDPQQAVQYIGCDSAARLHDPFLMKDMDKAVERLSEAVEQGEQIAVYGDYDCDGITATAMLYSYLEDLGARVIYYIPDRDVEGYGLNRAALDFLKEQQVELIVTVDNGISALDEAVYAKELGIDLIITDHHQPRPQLPQACAVIDPHRQDCEYPFKALCGAGVAFKLICAMEGDLGGEEMIWHFGELAAIATMADVVELTGENRLIVQRGLECIAQGEQVGVHALIEAAGMSGRKLDSIDLAFGLAPRINAAGRLGQTDLAMELLLCDRQSQAMELAQQLNELNEQRKALVDHIYEEINAKIARHPEILQERVILLYGEGWHHGVIGIAAARLVEEYSKPCVLFSIEEDQARGSARSVEGYSIIAAISRCSSLLTRYVLPLRADVFSDFFLQRLVAAIFFIVLPAHHQLVLFDSVQPHVLYLDRNTFFSVVFIDIQIGCHIHCISDVKWEAVGRHPKIDSRKTFSLVAQLQAQMAVFTQRTNCFDPASGHCHHRLLVAAAKRAQLLHPVHRL